MKSQSPLFILSCLFTFCSFLFGCGDGRPALVPVSGTVTVDGQPLKKGYIRVLPADARSAGGAVENGAFKLGTYEPDDGCVVGTHKVEVVASEKTGDGSTQWWAPKKYANVETAELTVSVDGPTDNLKVELSWNGGKPFVEKGTKE